MSGGSYIPKNGVIGNLLLVSAPAREVTDNAT